MSEHVEDRLRDVLAAVAERTPIGSAPSVPLPAPVGSRRRRLLLPTLGVTAVMVAAVGTAGATGHLPGQSSSWFSNDAAADPVVSARMVLSEPGPSGTRYEFWLGTTRSGSTCEAAFLNGSASLSPDSQLGPGWTGGECAPGGLGREFGNGGVGPYPAPDVIFWFAGGDAVKARLELSNGQVLPVAVKDGWIGGWFPSTPGVTATLTGYDAAGDVVGVRDMTSQGIASPTAATPAPPTEFESSPSTE